MRIVRPLAITDALLVSSNVPETDYPEYNPATTYDLGDFVIIAATHKIYQSLQAANAGHDPATSDTWWQDRGPTNRHRMFDESIGSQTQNPGSIAVSIVTVGRCDSIGVLNVAGSTIRAKMTDAIDGVVYDKTYSMISTSGITDLYAYLYEPIERDTALIITDLPKYAGATIEITIDNGEDIAACGCLIVGASKVTGSTLFGASIGMLDYSTKDTDTWGNYTVKEGAYSDTGSFTIDVDNSYTPYFRKLLQSYRAIPVLYIGSDHDALTALFGYFNDFSIDINYGQYSTCTINITSLT